MGVYCKNGKWFIDFYSSGGKRVRECVGTSKTKAKQALSIRKAEVLQGRYKFKGKKESLKFQDFATDWLDSKRATVKSSTIQDYNGVLTKHLLPAFSKIRIDSIDEEAISKFLSSLKDKLSNRRINFIFVVMKSIFKTAYRRKHTNSIPTEFIKSLREDKPKIYPLSMVEVSQFLETVAPHFKNYFTVAFFTGMRPSEQICLKWDSIDFPRSKIAVTEARYRGKEGTTKTLESNRLIDMLHPVRDALKEQAKSTFMKGSYVFLSKEGCILNTNHMREKVWRTALKRSGVSLRPMYNTRHTFATLMLSAGENPLWISKQLGHTTAEMLFEKYSRFIPNTTHQDGTAFMKKLSEDGHLLDTRGNSAGVSANQQKM